MVAATAQILTGCPICTRARVCTPGARLGRHARRWALKAPWSAWRQRKCLQGTRSAREYGCARERSHCLARIQHAVWYEDKFQVTPLHHQPTIVADYNRPVVPKSRLVSPCLRPEPCAKVPCAEVSRPPFAVAEDQIVAVVAVEAASLHTGTAAAASPHTVASFAVGRGGIIHRVVEATADDRACDIAHANPTGGACLRFSATWLTAEYPSGIQIASNVTDIVAVRAMVSSTTVAAVPPEALASVSLLPGSPPSTQAGSRSPQI